MDSRAKGERRRVLQRFATALQKESHWRADTGEELARFSGRPFHRPVFHPGLARIACGDTRGGLYVLDLAGTELGPLVVSPIDRGGGPEIRCPACSARWSIEAHRPGERRTVTCPVPACSALLQVNPFVVRWAARPRPGPDRVSLAPGRASEKEA